MNAVVVGFALATLVMYAIAVVASPSVARQGLRVAYETFVDPSIGLVPLIVAAVLIAGLVQAAIPREAVVGVLGKQAGLRGMALGTLLGAVTPGGPYVALPLASALHRSGASIGTLVAYLSSWSLLALPRIPLELPFVGVETVLLLRLATLVVLPIAMGIVAEGMASLAGMG